MIGVSGQGKHVCHTPSQWKSYLDFDTQDPAGSEKPAQTLARVVSGAGGAAPHPYAGMPRDCFSGAWGNVGQSGSGAVGQCGAMFEYFWGAE